MYFLLMVTLAERAEVTREERIFRDGKGEEKLQIVITVKCSEGEGGLFVMVVMVF